MVMVNQTLVTLVNSILGVGKPTARGNQAYACPKCKSDKLKLEVNFDSSSPHYQSFACWVCGFKGKKLHQMFKLIDVPAEKLIELKSIVKTHFSIDIPKQEEKIGLPKEFKSLHDITLYDIIGRHALAYLKARGITKDDILKYNMGYCETGKYANHIIIPSYDSNGNLNYFTARTFDKSNPIKYKNPSTSRNIIPFEMFINWDVPIILCEGPFDALAIKRNVIPLLGKTIQSSLMKKIVTSAVEKIYIALDKDAQKQALNFCENLMKEGKEVYLVDLQDKDPADMGFNNFTYLIQETYPLTFSDLLEKKIQLL
jgi:DNA primase